MQKNCHYLISITTGFILIVSSLSCRYMQPAEIVPSPNAHVATEEPAPQEELSPAPPETTPAPEIPPLKIAYLKDGNVWLYEEDRGTNPITTSGGIIRLNLSPDGSAIAYEHSLDYYHAELWSINSDGSAERLLMAISDFDSLEPEKWLDYTISLMPYQFDWVKGGTTIAYNTRQTFEGPGLALFNDLRLVDSTTSAKTTVLPSGMGGEFTYSPDGSLIAITNPTEIYLANNSGGNLRRVHQYTQVNTASEYYYYAKSVCSPDSSYFLAAIPPAEQFITPIPPTVLWKIPVDGTPPTEIGRFPVDFFSGLAISPDLQQVAYTSVEGELEENRRELHIANLDGSGDRVAAEGGHISLQGWSFAGDLVVYRLGEPLTLYGAPLTLAAGTRPLLAEAANTNDVIWADPQRFVVSMQNGDVWEIRLVSLDGTSTLIDSITGEPPQFDLNR